MGLLWQWKNSKLMMCFILPSSSACSLPTMTVIGVLGDVIPEGRDCNREGTLLWSYKMPTFNWEDLVCTHSSWTPKVILMEVISNVFASWHLKISGSLHFMFDAMFFWNMNIYCMHKIAFLSSKSMWPHWKCLFTFSHKHLSFSCFP